MRCCDIATPRAVSAHAAAIRRICVQQRGDQTVLKRISALLQIKPAEGDLPSRRWMDGPILPRNSSILGGHLPATCYQWSNLSLQTVFICHVKITSAWNAASALNLVSVNGFRSRVGRPRFLSLRQTPDTEKHTNAERRLKKASVNEPG